jgi:hypothetical protein
MCLLSAPFTPRADAHVHDTYQKSRSQQSGHPPVHAAHDTPSAPALPQLSALWWSVGMRLLLSVLLIAALWLVIGWALQ